MGLEALNSQLSKKMASKSYFLSNNSWITTKKLFLGCLLCFSNLSVYAIELVNIIGISIQTSSIALFVAPLAAL